MLISFSAVFTVVTRAWQFDWINRWLQVQCFGLGMLKLDCRQESSRHSDVLDTVTQYLGLGSYK